MCVERAPEHYYRNGAVGAVLDLIGNTAPYILHFANLGRRGRFLSPTVLEEFTDLVFRPALHLTKVILDVARQALLCDFIDLFFRPTHPAQAIGKRHCKPSHVGVGEELT